MLAAIKGKHALHDRYSSAIAEYHEHGVLKTTDGLPKFDDVLQLE
jgi:hypothetical protein